MNAAVLTPQGVKQDRVAVTQDADLWSSAGRAPSSAGRSPLVEYVGEKVILDHGNMKVGEVVPFRFGGRNVVAIKRRNGAIDIYRVP